MIEDDDVRAFFFSVDDFAVTAIFTPASTGIARSINGIFEDSHLALDNGGSVDFSVVTPTFMTRGVDVSNVEYGDQLVVNSATYLVRDVVPDGTGMTTLMLEAQ